jgi:CheY-like chemotaxis protein
MSRILIVEDDPAILCGLRDNREFESHQVLTAAHGEAGYRAVCEHAPELLILDLMPRKMSGYDLCRRVRGEGFNAPIPMLSARSQEGDHVLGLGLGANDYVSKPFSLRELLAWVRALLRHEREHRLEEAQLGGELEMAAKVQQSLFPRVLPEAPRLDYEESAGRRGASAVSGARRRQAGAAAGGCLRHKGISAALVGASLHAVVRANAAAAGERCGKPLAKASRLLFETTTADRYATVFYGVYDAATRTLTYANAGHYPPLLVREVRLGSLTPPAGMLPTLPACQERVQLFSEDWLLIFSEVFRRRRMLAGKNSAMID